MSTLAYSAGGHPRLGSRLVRAALMAAGVALLVAAVALNGFAYLTLRAGLVERLSVETRLAADQGATALVTADRTGAMRILESLQASPMLLSASLFDASGQSFARYVTVHSANTGGAMVPTTVPNMAVEFSRGQLTVVEAVLHEGKPIGSMVLVSSLNGLYQRMAAFVGISVIVGLAALGLAYILVARIKREMDASEEQLDDLAYVDPVTRLPNRHAANAQIKRMIDRVGKGSEGFALLLLDLDNFKIVNDTLGHPIGDELLKALAVRLGEQLPRGDMAFRYGGDEFLILSEGYRAPEHLRLIGQFALLTLDMPLTVGPHELQVRGCVGVAQFPRDATDASSLVRAADTAMSVPIASARTHARCSRPTWTTPRSAAFASTANCAVPWRETNCIFSTSQSSI